MISRAFQLARTKTVALLGAGSAFALTTYITHAESNLAENNENKTMSSNENTYVLPRRPRAPSSNTTWPCPSQNSNWVRPTVHLMSGMISSGKSSLSRHIAKEENAIIFSPDEIIMHLYGRDFDVAQFQTVGDPVKEVIWRAAQEVIARHNANVILDFSLWFSDDREFWRQRILQDSMHWFNHCEIKPWEFTKTDFSSTTENSAEQEHKFTAVSPAVQIKLHYIDCPTQICRDRLEQRNAQVMHARELESNANAEIKATSSSALASSDANERAIEIMRRYPDAMNFIIDISVFDNWSGQMQVPTEQENPNMYNCIHFKSKS